MWNEHLTGGVTDNSLTDNSVASLTSESVGEVSAYFLTSQMTNFPELCVLAHKVSEAERAKEEKDGLVSFLGSSLTG